MWHIGIVLRYYHWLFLKTVVFTRTAQTHELQKNIYRTKMSKEKLSAGWEVMTKPANQPSGTREPLQEEGGAIFPPSLTTTIDGHFSDETLNCVWRLVRSQSETCLLCCQRQGQQH